MYVGEKLPIQALESLFKAAQARFAWYNHDYRLHGTTTLFEAFDQNNLRNVKATHKRRRGREPRSQKWTLVFIFSLLLGCGYEPINKDSAPGLIIDADQKNIAACLHDGLKSDYGYFMPWSFSVKAGNGGKSVVYLNAQEPYKSRIMKLLFDCFPRKNGNMT